MKGVKTPGELAHWLANTNASSFGDQGATYEQWFAMIQQGWFVSGVYVSGVGIKSGVEACSEGKDM